MSAQPQLALEPVALLSVNLYLVRLRDERVDQISAKFRQMVVAENKSVRAREVYFSTPEPELSGEILPFPSPSINAKTRKDERAKQTRAQTLHCSTSRSP